MLAHFFINRMTLYWKKTQKCRFIFSKSLSVITRSVKSFVQTLKSYLSKAGGFNPRKSGIAK